MAQLQQLVLQLVVVMLVITAGFTWYSVALTNGGYTSPDIPLASKANLYYNQTYAFQKQFLASTTNATSSPALSDPATGLASLTAAGAQSLTLTFASINQMVDIINTAKLTLVTFGIPAYFFDYGVMFIVVLMGMLIFAAVYKWWI